MGCGSGMTPSSCRFAHGWLHRIPATGIWIDCHIPSVNGCFSLRYPIAHTGSDHTDINRAGAGCRNGRPRRLTIPTPCQIAAVVLALAVIKTTGDLSVYSRDDWRHWIDEDGDCQDARNEVLAAESRTDVTCRSDRHCRVDSGQWIAPYATVAKSRSRPVIRGRDH